MIDKLTNIRLGKKAPCVYLAEMESEFHEALPGVLRSHGLPFDKDGPFRTNDYKRAFLEWRLAHLAAELSTVVPPAS